MEHLGKTNLGNTNMGNTNLGNTNLENTKDKAECAQGKDNYQGAGLLRPFLSKASSSSLFPSRRKSQKYRKEDSPDPGITPVAFSGSSSHPPRVSLSVSSANSGYNGEEFIDLLNRSHGGRTEMEARDKMLPRSASPRRRATAPAPLGSVPSSQMDDLMELIAHSQDCRMNDQRVSAPSLLGTQPTQAGGTPAHRSESNGLLVALADSQQPCSSQATDEAFFDMVMRCQGSRLDDQRCAPPPFPCRAQTIPGEDFLQLIQRVNAKDEQRVAFVDRPGLE
uniref:G-protein-signaling modulator 2-like n=1 Tax=Myxine glutinosa TaxID=7769 RepID=UPI00358F24AB